MHARARAHTHTHTHTYTHTFACTCYKQPKRHASFGFNQSLKLILMVMQQTGYSAMHVVQIHMPRRRGVTSCTRQTARPTREINLLFKNGITSGVARHLYLLRFPMPDQLKEPLNVFLAHDCALPCLTCRESLGIQIFSRTCQCEYCKHSIRSSEDLKTETPCLKGLVHPYPIK
jgi:hypothetical protein